MSMSSEWSISRWMTGMIKLVFVLCLTLFAFADLEILNKSSDDYVPCENGWYYFRDKCYRGESRKYTWIRALRRCSEYGADLVSIHSQDEQDFINAFLLLNNKYDFTWTGLNDLELESDYRWSDRSDFNYTNWNANEPSGKGRDNGEEDCIYMYLAPVGTWNDVSCNVFANSICQKKANPKRRSPNMKYCSPEEGGGLKFKDSCYHLVTEMQAWSDAERYCKSNYNGHLLTIWDMFADSFLEYVLPDVKKEIWIGIKIQDQVQQKWTSGWYVTYDKFNKEEKYKEGTCAARKSENEWIKIPCSRQLPFICEVSKAPPLVLKSPPTGSSCPDEFNDWRDLGGENCYYIETNTSVNFSEARSHCQERGGDLVSIHSREESEILLPFIQNTGYSIFIGLTRVKDIYTNTFGWTDGSMLDYKNWEPLEPNRLDEKCVEALTFSMKWRDTLCSNKLSGYICSIMKVSPRFNVTDETATSSIVPPLNVSDESVSSSFFPSFNVTDETATSSITPNFNVTDEEATSSNFADLEILDRSSNGYVPCENGWYYFRDKCYRGESRKLTWASASARCRKYGADLVSIHSQEEQDFINAFLLLNHKYDFPWIGLNDRQIESDYRWSDRSVFNYTNWNANEPTGKGRDKDEEDCTYMYLAPVGKWNDVSCGVLTTFICEMKANPKRRSPNIKYCSPEEGGGIKFQDSCYHLVTEMQTWSDAEGYCKSNYNGHLLKIWDMFANSFLEYVLQDIKKEIWIGIKIQKQLQQKWTSGWYVTYDKFNEKEKYKDDTCAARKSGNEWIKIPCSRKLPFICEVSKAPPLVLKSPPVGSYCPKEFDDWRDLGGEYCYYIETNTNVNFSEARFHCEERGADLVSIHSRKESDILLPFIQNTGYSIFIGLIRVKDTYKNTFGWTDGSELDYKNWEPLEPNRKDEECVEALTFSMKWRDTLCSNKLSGYICSVKKVTPNFKVIDETSTSSIVPRFKVRDESASSLWNMSFKNLIGYLFALFW